MSKQPINIPLESSLKSRAEIVMHRIGLKWTDLLHDAVMVMLKEHDPQTYLEEEYKAGESALASLRLQVREQEDRLQALQREIVDIKDLPPIKTTQPADASDPFDEVREAMFQKNRDYIMKLHRSGALLKLNFDNIIMMGSFASKKEAVAWVQARARQEEQ